MTQIRKGAIIRKAKEIAIGGAFTLTLLSSAGVMQSCGSSDKEDDYSYEETTYSKGVRSHIKEVKPGEFKITDEENVDFDKSSAIVTYLDGHVDTLSVAASKALIDADVRNNSGNYHQGGGLSSMLLYGGIGYMLGRNSSNGYINNYRNQQSQDERRAHYAGNSAYARSNSAIDGVNESRSTRTVRSRPSGGRSGFFGSSRSRGFGG